MRFWLKRERERETAQGPAGPVSYAQWSTWFDAFAKGGDDDALLALATGGALAWSAGTAERLAERAGIALNTRLEATGRALQTALNRGRTEQDVERAVLDARRRLAMLRRYANLSCWPEMLSRQLAQMIGETATDLQKNLICSAEADRSGRLGSALRRTPLDELDRSAPPSVTATSPAPIGRRILL